jgi:hypothetical protein
MRALVVLLTLVLISLANGAGVESIHATNIQDESFTVHIGVNVNDTDHVIWQARRLSDNVQSSPETLSGPFPRSFTLDLSSDPPIRRGDLFEIEAAAYNVSGEMVGTLRRTRVETTNLLEPVERWLDREIIWRAEEIGDPLETSGFPESHVGKPGVTLPENSVGQAAALLTVLAIEARMREIENLVSQAQARVASGGLNPAGDQAIVESLSEEFRSLRVELVTMLTGMGILQGP